MLDSGAHASSVLVLRLADENHEQTIITPLLSSAVGDDVTFHDSAASITRFRQRV